MKQPKALTQKQKECVTAHYLIAKDWLLVEETEFYYKIIHKETQKTRMIDKFKRINKPSERKRGTNEKSRKSN